MTWPVAVPQMFEGAPGLRRVIRRVRRQGWMLLVVAAACSQPPTPLPDRTDTASGPPPPPRQIPRGTRSGDEVLRALRTTTNADRRASSWRRDYAGKPVAGQGLLLESRYVQNPVDAEAPAVLEIQLDVDQDRQTDIVALYFEVYDDRIPFLEPGRWVWYEGRSHEFDETVSPVTLTIGAHFLAPR